MPNRSADPTPRFPTLRGEKVRSLSEKYIADYLFMNKIDYQYEKPLRLEGYAIKPDFYLPAYNVYIEFWGMLDERNPKYWEGFRWKKQNYFKHGIKFVPIRPEDLPDLELIFPSKLGQAMGRKICAGCGNRDMGYQDRFCSRCGTEDTRTP